MSTLPNEKAIQLVFSPTNLSHVQGWFEETMCGRLIDYHNGWVTGNLTSLAHLGRISQRPRVNNLCVRCATHYKDVNING